MKTDQRLLSGILGVAAVTYLLACKKKKKKRDKTAKEPLTGDQDPVNTRPLFMNRLTLTMQQFEKLRKYQGNQLVFQFFYPGSDRCQSPTLYAYAMKSGNKTTGKPPEELSYGSVTGEPFTGRPQVLGDQQVLVKSMERLLDHVKDYQSKNLYFLFTPKFLPDNPHMYYEIRLAGDDGATSSVTRTNPSPPASAF